MERPTARILFAVALLAIGGAPSPAAACASCGCGDPTLTAMGVEKPFKNRIRLALEQRLSAHINEEGRTILARTTLAAAWSPAMWLTLGAALPVPSGELRAPSGTLRRFGGLGDLELYARPLVFRERRFSPRHLLSLLAGIKFPTGPRVADSSGYPAPDDLQPGSGSFDPVFGASYGYFGDAVAVFTSLSYRYTTVGRNGYRRGSVLAATALVQRGVHRLVALGLGLDMNYTWPDAVADDRPLPTTGGTILSATPQLLVALHRDILLRAALQIPMGQWWNESKTEFPAGVLSLVVDL